MRYKVPHNIDMQDRIVGPLTMLQFIEAVIGGGFAYVLFSGIPGIFGKILGIIIALLTLAIVFVKINERPFALFLASFIQYLLNPKKRFWHKSQSSSFDIEIVKPNPKEEKEIVTKRIDNKQIEMLAQKSDSSGYQRIKT